MKVFLAGMACVGKTATGAQLANLLQCKFIDLDAEIEAFFETPVERLQARFATAPAYRKEAARALSHVIARESGQPCVIALTPNGLKDHYWKVVKSAGGTVLVLRDHPENILNRLTFFDEDSRPLQRALGEGERVYYLRAIKRDIRHYQSGYARADQIVDISGMGIKEAAFKLREVLLARAPPGLFTV